MWRGRATVQLLAALPFVASFAQAQPAPQRSSDLPPLVDDSRRSAATSADDATRQQARELGYAGVKAYGAGDYAAASGQLERSFMLLPVPSLGLWSARALRKLRRLVEAERRYREVARMRVDVDAPEVQLAAQETAKAELLELLPRLPLLRIRLVGAPAEEVTILLDGTPLAAERWSLGEPVNPGSHRVVGTYGNERSELDLTATEGRESEIMLRFSPPAPAASPPLDAPSNPWQVGGWTAVGTGTASLALSTVMYFKASQAYDEMIEDGLCAQEQCVSGPRLERYGRFRTLQLVSMGVGLVLGLGGATLLILDPGAAPRTKASGAGLRLGLGTAEIWGRF